MIASEQHTQETYYAAFHAAAHARTLTPLISLVADGVEGSFAATPVPEA